MTTFLPLIISIVAIGLALWSWAVTRKQNRSLADLFAETGHAQFGEILALHHKRLQTQSDNVKTLHSRLHHLEEESQKLLSPIGLVKYNPFDGTGGGNMSFSAALINAHGDGVILTSLHSREGMRLYSKAVRGFVAEQTLTEEEKQALQQVQDII